MLNTKLHIISFDVPYPADYGGVIDVFHKIRLIHALGVQIHLHCFDYGRGRQAILENFCQTVSYYPRITGLKSFLSSKPYIVQSRRSKELVDKLLEDDSPILCEGIHSAAILLDARFAKRKIGIRPTNIEHDYYRLLASREKNFLHRMYYLSEAYKLKRFDKIHNLASAIFPVSDADDGYFKMNFPQIPSRRIFPFNGMDRLEIEPGKGKYAFFHGNLSVAENEEIANYLMNDISGKIAMPLIIAGKNPSSELRQKAEKMNVRLIANPTDAEMDSLVAEAHVQLMITFQPTGFKHKLLLSVFRGRHIVANKAMLSGSGMESLVHVAESSNEIIDKVNSLAQRPFSQEDIKFRSKNLLHDHLNNHKAEQFLRWISGEEK